ncbi:MAG: hypothetical protein U0031_14525 [Thermomicrobiales bacterium]
MQLQIRNLQQRLAFYEGFDSLIQDNVAQSRELLRLAAKERADATASADRVRMERESREREHRAELQAIQAEVTAVSQSLLSLGRRLDTALNSGTAMPAFEEERTRRTSIAVIVHGVPSARTALSLQRLLSSLPFVNDVQAREFSAGVLRLEVSGSAAVTAAHFAGWEDPRSVEVLTERPDALEIMLRPAIVAKAGD